MLKNLFKSWSTKQEETKKKKFSHLSMKIFHKLDQRKIKILEALKAISASNHKFIKNEDINLNKRHDWTFGDILHYDKDMTRFYWISSNSFFINLRHADICCCNSHRFLLLFAAIFYWWAIGVKDVCFCFHFILFFSSSNWNWLMQWKYFSTLLQMEHWT